MSFSYDVKTELCKNIPDQKCCILAECYGILMFCNTFDARQIRIITENSAFASSLHRLFRRAFGIEFDSVIEKHSKTQFSVNDKNKLDKIYSSFGAERLTFTAHHINYGIIEDDCCRQSFIRGAFLAGGSVTDPDKQYHLEIVTDHFSVSRETYSLLLDMGMSPKETSRGGNYIIYFKSSEMIEDMLTSLGAPLAAMKIMSAKIEKNMNNMVNRKVNCDTANVNKTVDAAQIYIDAIKRLETSGKLAELPEKLRETAKLRMENPELNLNELSLLFDPPVTKSGLSHRLRRILELSGER